MEKIQEKVKMEYGAELATDIYLPNKDDKFPSLLILTLYVKDSMGQLTRPFIEG